MSSTESTHPEIYYSYLQLHRRVLSPVLTLMACTSGKPEKLAPALRAVVRETDADAALDNISTMEDRMARYLAEPRLYAIVLCGFAAFSLIVAGVGLLGVLSYIVAQRSRELALRMALGARQIDIIRQVLCQGMTVAATGLGIGLLASAALSHFIAAMLYGVTPYDPLTYLTVPIILLSVASAACIAPALRAARLDPIRLLRG
jgi:ABC-type antimicrobial peptide transport system permease subunit